MLVVASGAEMLTSLRSWMSGQAPWPRALLLDALVAGSAILLAIAVLMTRRSVLRTAKVEEALRESEERLRLVANNVPALISYVDREQRYRFSNRTYDDWFGISQDRMLGRTVAEVFGDEHYGRMKPHFDRVLAGEEVEFEFAPPRRAAARAAGCLHAAPRGRGAGLLQLATTSCAQARAERPTLCRHQLQHDRAVWNSCASRHADRARTAPCSGRAREAVAHARRTQDRGGAVHDLATSGR